MRSHVEKNLLSRQHARPALIQGHLKFFGSRVLLCFAEPAATLLGSARACRMDFRTLAEFFLSKETGLSMFSASAWNLFARRVSVVIAKTTRRRVLRSSSKAPQHSLDRARIRGLLRCRR
jgi:hypothetical protein